MGDIRFSVESARFSEASVRPGLVPGDGGCYRLTRLVGRAKARAASHRQLGQCRGCFAMAMVNGMFNDDAMPRRLSSLVGWPPVRAWHKR
jgi:enoyl-CoA hydratase/carnithine racemase